MTIVDFKSQSSQGFPLSNPFGSKVENVDKPAIRVIVRRGEFVAKLQLANVTTH